MSRKKYKPRAEPQQRVQTNDAFQNPLTRAGFSMPNLLEATQYPITRFTWKWQEINSLYRGHWIVQRIIEVVPGDMMKNGYKILSQLDPGQLRKITKVERQTRINKKIEKGLCWGRLYGGAAGLILIKGHEDILDQPLEFDQIMPGSFKGLLIIDRWSGVSPDLELITDISDPDFGMPEYYTITADGMNKGIRVHYSRICRFEGREMPYVEKLAENYWGTSELEHVMEDLKKRDNVSWNIAMLTFMANIRTLKIEGMGQLLSTGNEKMIQNLYATVQAQNMLMNNNGVQILGENDEYQSHQYAFSGLGEVYDRFMMDIAGAAEIPVTKLFGRSPAGMNATGESDMRNYYDAIERKQESDLRPIYDKILPIIMMSELGGIPDDFDYDFNPVQRPKDDEQADLASKSTDSVTKAYAAGMISQKIALKELKQQSELTGMWSNITDADIESADEQVMLTTDLPLGNPNMTQDAAFEESEHPRDDDGMFTNGSNGGTEGLSESARKLIGKEYKGYTGQDAINKLLEEKNGHIKNAYNREDIGAIDLIWGDDSAGLQHIIKQRTAQGFTQEKLSIFLSELSDVIVSGNLVKNSRGTFEITHNGKIAVVSPELHGNKLMFLLTAFKRRTKK